MLFEKKIKEIKFVIHYNQQCWIKQHAEHTEVSKRNDSNSMNVTIWKMYVKTFWLAIESPDKFLNSYVPWFTVIFVLFCFCFDSLSYILWSHELALRKGLQYIADAFKKSCELVVHCSCVLSSRSRSNFKYIIKYLKSFAFFPFPLNHPSLSSLDFSVYETISLVRT